jgi:hypothetical protein
MKDNEIVSVESLEKKITSVEANSPFASKLEMMEIAIQNKLLPPYVKTAQLGLILIERAKELGLPPFASFDMFYQINGKLALQSNGLSAIIKKNKGRYTVVRNNEEVFVTDNPKNHFLEGNYLRYDPTTNEISPTGRLKSVGYKVTTIIATRPDESHEVKHIVNFTSQEAHGAGLLVKDVWQKYPEAMMFNRCLAKMARQVFPDFIAGMYPAEELDEKDTLLFDEEGRVIGEKN